MTVKGDYFFTIGAPVLGVERLPGSEAAPGFRSTSIIWQGFNPLRRRLNARARLDPAQAGFLLPLRIEAHGRTTTLVNTTAVTVTTFTADAEPAPIAAYVQSLRRALQLGRPIPEGTVTLTTQPRPKRVRVSVPLVVVGTIGGRHVSATVTGRLTVPTRGRIAVAVRPVVPAPGTAAGLSGREALARATMLTLTVARLRQYEQFLGNPDPAGVSTAIYVYRSAVPPRISVSVQPVEPGRDWTTIAVVGGILLAAGAGLAVWARA